MFDPSTIGMAYRYRPPQPAEGLEAARKVGWAKFYQQLERAETLAGLSHRQRDRIKLLMEALRDLTGAVLHAKNLEAFGLACRIQSLLDELDAEE
jgi:hypothetical protein